MRTAPAASKSTKSNRRPPPLSVSDRRELAIRQTAELYRLMPASIGFSYLGAILVFLMLMSTGDATRGVYWFAYASTVMLFRMLVICEYRNHANTRGNSPEVWKWMAIVMNLAAGIQWGLLGTVLYEPEPTQRAVFMAIMVVGYVGGSIVSFAPVRFAHAALAIPAVLPATIYLFFVGDNANLIAGVASLFMLSAVIVTAEIQYRIIRGRLLLEIAGDANLRAAQAANTTLGAESTQLAHRAEVTKRSQIEARRRADTLSHHMQNTLLPVIECDRSGRVVEWNAAAAAAFGYQLLDLADTPLGNIIRTRDGERDWEAAFLSSLDGKVAAAIDTSVTAKDGKRILAKLYVTPIDTDGRPSGRAAIIATLVPDASRAHPQSLRSVGR